MTTRTVKPKLGVRTFGIGYGNESNYKNVNSDMRLGTVVPAGVHISTSSNSEVNEVTGNTFMEFVDSEDNVLFDVTTFPVTTIASFPGEHTTMVLSDTGESDHLHLSIEVQEGVGFLLVNKADASPEFIEELNQQCVDNDITNVEQLDVQTTLGIDLSRQQLEQLYIALRSALQRKPSPLNTNQWGYDN